jgi:hypothetical protein
MTASDYVAANGVQFPNKRRAYSHGPDRRPILEMLMVKIDIDVNQLENPIADIVSSNDRSEIQVDMSSTSTNHGLGSHAPVGFAIGTSAEGATAAGRTFVS